MYMQHYVLGLFFIISDIIPTIQQLHNTLAHNIPNQSLSSHEPNFNRFCSFSIIFPPKLFNLLTLFFQRSILIQCPAHFSILCSLIPSREVFQTYSATITVKINGMIQHVISLQEDSVITDQLKFVSFGDQSFNLQSQLLYDWIQNTPNDNYTSNLPHKVCQIHNIHSDEMRLITIRAIKRIVFSIC